MTTDTNSLGSQYRNPADDPIRSLLVFSSEFSYTLEEPSSQQYQKLVQWP